MSDISVIVEGLEFKAWTKVELVRNFDSVDTLSVTYPFDPNNINLINIFKPFSYATCQILYSGKLVFTGLLLDTVPSVNNTEKTETANFYATPGTLIDCTATQDRETLQFINKSFKTICSELCSPFNLGVKYTSAAQQRSNSILDKIELGCSEPIFSFLAKIAHTENLYLSSTSEGDLLVRQANPSGKAVLDLKEDLPPLISVNAQYNPRQYYSAITAVCTGTQADSINGRSTVKNDKIKKFRPYVFQSQDSEKGGIEKAAKSKLTRMYSNSVTYQVGIVGWTDKNNSILSTNKIVLLEAPSIRIKSPYKFNIRSIRMTAEANTESSFLDLVLPESFTDSIPSKFPWD